MKVVRRRKGYTKVVKNTVEPRRRIDLGAVNPPMGIPQKPRYKPTYQHPKKGAWSAWETRTENYGILRIWESLSRYYNCPNKVFWEASRNLYE
jgi:hypothetical protein